MSDHFTTPPVPDLPFTLERLASGVRLLCAPMRDRTSASIVLMLSTGSRHESAEMSGVSHFIEHLCFKGTARRAGAKEIAEAIEGVGGVLNAATDKESTVYYAKVPAAQLPLASDVLADLVLAPRFDAADMDRERTVILEEIKMYEDLPQEHVHSLFEECVWPEHSLGRDIAGSRETVSALSRTQLADHFAREYRAERILIVAAGALAAESVRETVESIFAAACAGTSPAPAPAPTPFTEPRLVLRTRRTEQAHICVGGLSSSYQSPLRYAEEILNTVLGEGMSSRLFLEVREKRGLAYDVHSFMTKYSDTGLHGVYAGVETRRAREAVSAILHEARRLAEELVPPAELEKAREFYKGRLLLSLESTNGLAAWLGGQELLLGRVEQPAEVLARLDAVTAEEVRAAARRLYVDQPLRLAVIGPFRSEAPFLKLIAG